MAEIWPTVDGVVDVPELARPLWDQIGDGVSMEDVGECINNYQGTLPTFLATFTGIRKNTAHYHPNAITFRQYT